MEEDLGEVILALIIESEIVNARLLLNSDYYKNNMPMVREVHL